VVNEAQTTTDAQADVRVCGRIDVVGNLAGDLPDRQQEDVKRTKAWFATGAGHNIRHDRYTEMMAQSRLS